MGQPTTAGIVCTGVTKDSQRFSSTGLTRFAKEDSRVTSVFSLQSFNLSEIKAFKITFFSILKLLSVSAYHQSDIHWVLFKLAVVFLFLALKGIYRKATVIT